MHQRRWSFLFLVGASVPALVGSWAPPAMGQLHLGFQELVQDNGVDIAVPGYSVPSLVDWNSDGLPDLIVGEGSGTYVAMVRVYLNAGSLSEPAFSGFFHAEETAGGVLTVPGGG